MSALQHKMVIAEDRLFKPNISFLLRFPNAHHLFIVKSLCFERAEKAGSSVANNGNKSYAL